MSDTCPSPTVSYTSHVRDIFMLKSIQIMSLCFLCVSFSSYSKTIDDSFFKSNGINIHYVDTGGEGMPVVLIHGYTMSLDMWYESEIVEKLSKNYRVITVDLRGHGKSDKPATPLDYGPNVGLDVINLLKHLEIPKAHMIGYSMGAFVVGRLLVTHPEKILSATLGSGSFPIASEDEEEFQESTARGMEAHGNQSLASVARGWAYDAVTKEQITKITVPMRAVFGSEEINSFYYKQKELIETVKSALPILVIDGTDHDSDKAAILHPDFLTAAIELISSIN